MYFDHTDCTAGNNFPCCGLRIPGSETLEGFDACLINT